MEGSFISVNGIILPAERAFIPADDRGVMFGWGVFETIRIYKGVPFMLQEHMERLRSSLDPLRIPVNFDADTLTGQIVDYVRQTGNDNRVLRVTMTRGGTGPPNTIITSRGIGYSSEDYQKGFRLKSYPGRRNANLPLVYLKTLNYLDNILVREEAIQAGFNEALLLNSEGWLSECSCSNLFFVKNRALFTPSTDCGLLEGIAGRMVAASLIPSLGMTLNAGKFRLENLYSADEIFITNSVLQVMPVVRVDDREIGGGAPGRVVQSLMEAYEKYVDWYIKRNYGF